jgi:hypothetical protein
MRMQLNEATLARHCAAVTEHHTPRHAFQSQSIIDRDFVTRCKGKMSESEQAV